jgi:hypothetical protein
MKPQIKKIDFTTVRSFLFDNVDLMLENISAKRESNKNTSEDIFGFADDSQTRINWQTNNLPKSKLIVLKEERSALGVYMTGKPLEDYVASLEYFRKITGMGNQLQLAIIDKVKKIFTRANAMMFALQLSLIDQEIEGVIFSKKAMEYSPILAENELFWIIGHIDEKKLEDLSKSELDGEKDNEYVEKPKFIINHIVPIETGILNLLQTSQTPPDSDYCNLFPSIDWLQYKNSPQSIDLDETIIDNFKNKYKFKDLNTGPRKPFEPNKTSKWVKKEDLNQNTNQKKPTKTKVTLLKSLGSKLLEIKAAIKKEYFEGSIPIELWIETDSGEIKKTKGDWWLPIELLQK